ncbi:MAG: PorT family protein [Paludibacteraceae bacterium]|nr:PorT family protein [Paludibacteraceae bacterium]
MELRDLKFKSYQLAFFLLLLSMAVTPDVSARRSRPDNFHFWAVGFSGGYSTLVEDYRDLNTSGSVGFTGHFGYEYENQGFWLSPMLELQYFSSKAHSSVNVADSRIIDTQLKDATMHYEMMSGLSEEQRFLYLNIPFMAGYYSHTGFYFGAGFRLGFNLGISSSSTFSYRTSATYDSYFDDFTDMPNHCYTDYTQTNDTAHFHSIFKVSFLAEIGYDVMAHKHRSQVKYSALKLGAFAEYGLNNVIDVEGNGKVCKANPTNASHLIPGTYYGAYHTKKHHVVPLVVGIRLTFLFYVKGKGAYCPKCRRRFY